MAKHTITDAQGTAHEYVVGAHPLAEGLAVSLRILALGSGPLAAVFAGGMASAGDVLAADAGALSRAISEAIGKLSAAEVEGLLAYTVRDGEPLGNPLVRDRVYRANYGELYSAVALVVGLNGFFPPPATWSNAAKLARTVPTVPGAPA